MSDEPEKGAVVGLEPYTTYRRVQFPDGSVHDVLSPPSAWADYVKAQERIAALEAENARLREAIRGAPCPQRLTSTGLRASLGCIRAAEGAECDCWKRRALRGGTDD